MGTAMSKNFNQLVHDAAAAPWNLAVEPFKVAPRIYYVGKCAFIPALIYFVALIIWTPIAGKFLWGI